MCMCVVLCVIIALFVAIVGAVAPFEASDKHLLPFGCLGAHGYFLSGRPCSNLTSVCVGFITWRALDSLL